MLFDWVASIGFFSLDLDGMKPPEGAQSCWESYDEAHQQFGPKLGESNMESNRFWEAFKDVIQSDVFVSE